MSQSDYSIPGSPLPMTTLKAKLEEAFSALATANSGSVAPANPSAGWLWWDTSGDPTYLLKCYSSVSG